MHIRAMKKGNIRPDARLMVLYFQVKNQISSIIGDSLNNLTSIYHFGLELLETAKDQRNATCAMVLDFEFQLYLSRPVT